MWVTTKPAVELFGSFPTLLAFTSFTHNLSHKIKSLNSPLTWGYSGFPQINGLATTTTYNYMKTPMRFLLSNFFNHSIIKRKNLQSFTTAGRLTK